MDTQSYARNMERYFELNKIPDSVLGTRDDLINHLVQVAHEKRNVLMSNNSIIDEVIVPFEKGTRVPTDEDIKELNEFFMSLYVNGDFYDRGTCERIVHIIYNTYLLNKKYDLAAQQLQKIYYFDIVNNSHQILGKTTISQKLVDEWTGLFDVLGESGKVAFISFLLAIVYNENEKQTALNRMNLAVKYINLLGKDVNDKSNRQLYNSYRSALIDLLGHVCDALDLNICAYSDAEMKQIDEYRKKVIEEYNAGNLNSLPFSPEATLRRLEYFFGEITQEELLDWLLEYAKEQSQNADSKSYVNAFNAEANYFSTIQKNYNGTQEQKEVLWNRALEAITDSFGYTEKRKDDFYVFGSSAQLVQILSSQIGFEKAGSYVFDITVFHDKALSIHTVMVGKISQIILDEILKDEPEFLEGVCGYSLDYIKNNKDSIVKLLHDCALFHDIGKHYCLDYVQIAYRNLTDREFAMIKCHPEDFEKFFPVGENDSEELKCIRDCALLHHTWHDGTKGYPIRKHTYNRPFVDILSIADSVDAATDIIGRPYTKGKSLDDLIEEFEGFTDTRYSNKIIELLKKTEVKNKIEQLIGEGRKDITYAAYANRHFDKNVF